VRLARLWVRDDALAEDLVQDCWLTALHAVHSFQGRARLKTWLCGILHNLARARLRKEQRTISFDASGSEPAVPAERFRPGDHRWPGHWASPPPHWAQSPEKRLLTAELREKLEAAIAELPDNQRMVLILRDVEGLDGEEVCNVLGVSDTNQRVLLHRARAKLRTSLETWYARGDL
jgi:RNA polymerase sigma-70 factor (ECF subfamily)